MNEKPLVYQKKDMDILINPISSSPTKKEIEYYIFECLKYSLSDHISLNKAIKHSLEKCCEFKSWEEYYKLFHAGLKLKTKHYYDYLTKRNVI